MISSETKTILKAYEKVTTEIHELRVVATRGGSFPYFLRTCETAGFTDQLDFRWVKKEKIKASITFALSRDSEAISLPQAPFGGISIEGKLSSAGLDAFIVAVLAELKYRKVVTVKIVQPPKPYETNLDLINYLLFKNGFVQDSVLSHQFFVGKKKLKKLVNSEHIKYQSRARELGVICQTGPIPNFTFLKDIRAWNQEKGYEANFDDERIINQVSDFPERYFLISILKDGKAIAHSLCVKLLPNSFYYFLSAIHPKSTLKNIGEMCLFQLFQLAADHQADFVDLGSSDTVAGANHSLMFFKSRFSNDVSNKIGWALKL